MTENRRITMDNKFALKSNSAGIRLIAQMTIYNSGDFERLRRLVEDSYSDDLLGLRAADDWLAMFKDLHRRLGKLRVMQVLALDKYQVVVLMLAQNDSGFYIHDLKVDPEYPHKVIGYSQSAVA